MAAEKVTTVYIGLGYEPQHPKVEKLEEKPIIMLSHSCVFQI